MFGLLVVLVAPFVTTNQEVFNESLEIATFIQLSSYLVFSSIFLLFLLGCLGVAKL